MLLSYLFEVRTYLIVWRPSQVSPRARTHHQEEQAVKYTFLSKWTVLIMTLITGGLTYYGIYLITHQNSALYAILALVGGLVVYGIAWLIALADSIQERKWGWSVLLFLLIPIWVGPLLYSVFGPRNTR